eukprot:GHVL01028620.1.p1 GENE.GHVL01028620.1~~GHVL01028620.1.p1  ORF type:complete len:821 (-),score=111.16 GHVL01028620.1:504-2966(-)
MRQQNHEAAANHSIAAANDMKYNAKNTHNDSKNTHNDSLNNNKISMKYPVGHPKAGLPYIHSSSRIDPGNMPRPCTQRLLEPIENDRSCGSASSRFMRMVSTHLVAQSPTAALAGIPLGLVIQPFAELSALCDPIPEVDFDLEEPVRCPRCKAYINPYMSYSDGGGGACCNICRHVFELPAFYASLLSNNRLDVQKPELLKGSIDIIAPPGYFCRTPRPPIICFVIDVSYFSNISGCLSQMAYTVKSLLEYLPSQSTEVCIVTFDETVHFYALDTHGSPKMFVMADINDPFVPASVDILCVNPRESRTQIDQVLDGLPAMFGSSKLGHSCGNTALQAAIKIASDKGGGLVVQTICSVSTTGVGATTLKDDKISTRKEESKGLYTPQHLDFYQPLLNECIKYGVGVDIFCCAPPNAFFDTSSLGYLPRHTGGSLYLYSNFKKEDPECGERLHWEVVRTCTRKLFTDCVIKTRCSKGLSIIKLLSPISIVDDHSTFRLPKVDPDFSFALTFKHDQKLESKSAFFQVAVLHTNLEGKRLIRVHTISVPITSSLSNCFRYTLIDPLTNILLRSAAMGALSGADKWSEEIQQQCVNILYCYRMNCTTSSHWGQLVLPESLKLLPCYVNAMLKTLGFRKRETRDQRVVSLLRILRMPVYESYVYMYPKVFDLSDFSLFGDFEGENVKLPPLISATAGQIANTGIYIVDNSSIFTMFVGNETPTDTLLELFGIEFLDIESKLQLLNISPEEQSDKLKRVNGVVYQLRKNKIAGPCQALKIVNSRSPYAARFFDLLLEDDIDSQASYGDYLLKLHKIINTKVDNALCK